MMRKEMRLPWAGTLLSPTSSEGQQFKKLAVEQDPGPSEKGIIIVGRWSLDNLNLMRNYSDLLNLD